MLTRFRVVNNPPGAAVLLAASMIVLLATTGCEHSPTDSIVGGVPNEESGGSADKSMMRSPSGDRLPIPTVRKRLSDDVLSEWRNMISAPGNKATPTASDGLAGNVPSAAAKNGRGHPTGELVQTVRLYRRLFGAAVSRDGVVGVTLVDGSAIAFLDAESGTITGEVIVGSIPTNLAFDPKGKTAYVTCQNTGNVAVVDVANHTLVEEVDVAGSPFHVAFSPNGKTVYTTSNFNEVTAIDATTRQIVGSVGVGRAPNGIAMQSGQRLLFVSCFNDGSIHLIDRRRLQPVAVIETGVKVQDLALSRDGRRLYAADEYGSFLMLDVDEGTISSLPLPGGAFGMALTPDRTRAYLGIPSRGEIVVVELKTMEIESTIDVGGRPRRIAFTRSGDCAVVADEAGAVHFIR